jgi:hypothetical protein
MAIWTALVSPITGLIKTFQEGRQKKAEARATVDRIFAEASAKDASVAGQIALVKVNNENTTWKDEYALLVLSVPLVVLMVVGACEGAGNVPPGTTGAVADGMFGSLDAVPEWWSSTFKAAMLSAVGITLWNKSKKVI